MTLYTPTVKDFFLFCFFLVVILIVGFFLGAQYGEGVANTFFQQYMKDNCMCQLGLNTYNVV